MNANLTCTRRRLLRRAPLILPLAWAAPVIQVPHASAQQGPIRPLRRTWRQDAAYTETPLADVPDGMRDVATDINDTGTVVGWTQNEQDMFSVAVAWRAPGDHEVLADLGGQSAEAYAINDGGQIAGTSMNADGDIHPVLWTDGVPMDLGTLGGLNGIALGLNDNGQVVGWAETRDGETHAFLWDNGEMTDLAEYDGSIDVSGLSDDEVDFMVSRGGSYANDINNAGLVVGRMGFPLAFMSAVLWADGEMTDLGNLGGMFADARAINDNGQVTGRADIASGDAEEGTPHPFIWQDGEMTDLGVFTDGGWGIGTDINASGHLSINGGGDPDEDVPIFWNGEFIRLASAGGANGLNDAGVVVGSGYAAQGEQEAVAMQWNPAVAG